ncbi:MAG: ABC transporter permease subunit [Chloroflexi bacterium]|nr:ABC transporter permease subunit [Chloroflexota bacterium]
MNDTSLNRIVLILRKEWLELRQQRGLIFGTLLPPLIFALLPIVLAYLAGHTSLTSTTRSSLSPTPTATPGVNPSLAGLPGAELGQAIVGQQFSILLLLVPVIIPSVIASYSIIGEKTSGTLEPLLATPVRTWELLLAKMLTSVIPAVAITWLVGLIFTLGMALTALSSRVFIAIISPGWIAALILCTPLLALIVVAATVAVSSRVSDPRSAQQISATMILPIMLIFFGQITGLLVLSPFIALIAALLLALIALLALWLTTRIFQREAILTRWS